MSWHESDSVMTGGSGYVTVTFLQSQRKSFALKQLEIVDLSGNDLTTVPERLWDLPNLKGVNLIGNPIESLPNRPGLTIDLPIYRRCRGEVEPKNIELVIGADTSEEDAAFSELDQLQSLSIRGLGLGAVPESIRNLPRLSSLSLNGLSLKALPDWIAEFNLQNFSAFDNRLSDLPPSFRQLAGLKTLDLRFNRSAGYPTLCSS